MAVSASQPVQVNLNELKNNAVCFPKNLHGNLEQMNYLFWDSSNGLRSVALTSVLI